MHVLKTVTKTISFHVNRTATTERGRETTSSPDPEKRFHWVKPTERLTRILAFLRVTVEGEVLGQFI